MYFICFEVDQNEQTSFFYSSIYHWNKLPTEIKQCQVKNNFRKKVTTLFSHFRLLYSRLMADELSP